MTTMCIFWPFDGLRLTPLRPSYHCLPLVVHIITILCCIFVLWIKQDFIDSASFSFFGRMKTCLQGNSTCLRFVMALGIDILNLTRDDDMIIVTAQFLLTLSLIHYRAMTVMSKSEKHNILDELIPLSRQERKSKEKLSLCCLKIGT